MKDDGKETKSMARKASKFRLYPNKETEKQLYFTLNRCRELYNACVRRFGDY